MIRRSAMGPADDRPSRAEDLFILRQMEDVRRRFSAASKASDRAEMNRLNIVLAELRPRGREAQHSARECLGLFVAE